MKSECSYLKIREWSNLAVGSSLILDVGVDVGVSPQLVTTHHTNRDFGDRGTVPDDMEHDGTALQARDYETATLPRGWRRPWRFVCAGRVNDE